jgi:hypothetical protein
LGTFLNPTAWPSQWLERRGQLQTISERVKSVGGWDAVKKDCALLANEHENDVYDFWQWFDWETNTIPPAIGALKPKSVEYYQPIALDVLIKNGGNSVKYWRTNEIVEISIFGAHATGGHDEPALGLHVLLGKYATNEYHPAILRFTTPLRYWRFRKITDGVYAVY